MKNNLKTLFTIAGCIILFAGIVAFNSQEKGSDTIMIRSTQYGAGGQSVIMVYKGDGVVERIELSKWKGADQEENYDKIISTIRKYEKMGYEVMSSSGSDGNPYVDTFIMTKK